MTHVRLKVTQVGSSLGVILPKELLSRFKIEKGDNLIVSETPNGFQLTAYEPNIEAQLEIARKGMRKYRDALRELAK